MKPYLKQEIWEKSVAGWLITDCAVRDKNIVYLCLRKDIPEEEASRLFDHDIPSKLFGIYLHLPDNQYGAQQLESFNKPRCGVSQKPIAQGMLAARNVDGDVFAMGGGRNGALEQIHPQGHPITMRIKCINGYAYSVGAGRSIYKRVDIGKWVKIDEGFPTGDATSSHGFNDMDAFSETDMYAVGGHGDIWHYNGKRWQRMGFPTNMQLGTVTCAGDGNVYVTGEAGHIWVGRESTWKRVYTGDSTLLWNDALWFENKLWLASDYQLRQWNGKEMQKVEHQGKQIHTSGHMDARDGLLVIASPSEVRAYDGKEWRLIVAPYA